MQQAHHIGPDNALAGARIAILATNAIGLEAIEQALWRIGARVERLAPDVSPAELEDADALLIGLDQGGGRRPYPYQVERLRLALPSKPIVALLDEPPIPVPEELADFVASPFNPREVVARLARVIMRRPGRAPIAAGNLVLDPGARTVHIGTRPVEVTFREFEALRALLLVDGRVLARAEIAMRLGCASTGRAVDIHVHRLRAKLDGLIGARITTVRGVGYRLECV